MGSRNRYDGINAAIIRSVRAHAQRLSRSKALPALETEDIEQELVLHVLRRLRDFDPKRASFATFVDRIVRHRAVALHAESRTLKRGLGIDIISFSDLEHDPGTASASPREQSCEDPILLGAAVTTPEHEIMLRRDLRRLITMLPDRLRQSCAWLLDDSISAACRRTGLARSSVYERLSALRKRCQDADLEIYLGRSRTVSTPFR